MFCGNLQNGSVDAGASDGYDSSQEGSPPTSGFELGENTVMLLMHS